MIKQILLSSVLSFYAIQAGAVTVGEQPPACGASMIDSGLPLDLSGFRGKAVVLDFWATWCPPCKKSIPFFNRLQQRYGADGLQVIAVSVDENPDDAREFLQKFPVDYQVALDPAGDCPQKYQVKAMPSTYFIDRQGTIRTVHLGFRDADREDMTRQILMMLDQR